MQRGQNFRFRALGYHMSDYATFPVPQGLAADQAITSSGTRRAGLNTFTSPKSPGRV
jgi:hypothetical protein